MATKTARRSVSMTPEMRDLLQQIAAKRGREITEADLIREAIRRFLDEQEDIVGSRRHFQKSLQERIDRLEDIILFQLDVIIYLVTLLSPALDGDAYIEEAVIAARTKGEALQKQIAAVRDLPAVGKR